MEEQGKVQGAGEGTSQLAETPSTAPGTTAPETITREDLARLERLLEDRSRHWQGQTDKVKADAERRIAELEERLEEAQGLLAGGVAYDPLLAGTQQAYDPYAAQRQRVLRPAPNRVERELGELRKRQEAQEEYQKTQAWIDKTLRDAKLSRAEVDPERFTSGEEFETEVRRIRFEREEAAQRKALQEKLAKMEEDAQKALREKLGRGEEGDFVSGGPAGVSRSSEGAAEELREVSNRFNQGLLDADTYRKKREELLKQMT